MVVAETGKIDVDILGQGPSAETRALNFEIQKTEILKFYYFLLI